MTKRSPRNIRELLEAQVERSPDKEFLFLESDGRVLTYREFDAEVNRAARMLLSAGVAKGERASLYLTNRAEYLIFYFACFKVGAWACPVNAHLKPQEIEYIVANSEAGIIVTQPDLYPNLSEARAHVSSLGNVIVIEDGGQWSVENQRLINDNQPPPADISGDDEAVIIYTSGTTGKPKGVLLTHGNILSNAEQIADWLRLTEDDRSLMIMPLFHVNALMTTAMAALWVGASIVLAPRFSASRHWETVSRFGVTYFGSVATMLSLLNHTYPEGMPATLDTGRLRFALCGSAPVPVEVIRVFESLFHCPVIEGYGLSESTCRSTFNPVDERRRAGSVGLPIGNEVRVFDETDTELGPDRVGEIVLRGPNVMKGYYKNAAATEAVFRSGWFHTGDLGYKDRDGFFYVVDRKSDMIIRGGENVYPREIDEVLYGHPKVKDAATIGTPDPLYGEEIKSFVVLREGCQATEEEIREFCRARLADFKCPKAIEFLDDIPKGPTGKLLKRELANRK
ncbi:MAG TPA: long-chain-fatty-acid--CoA ligase [Blastocatellia bacterium]|nr:long-chain-fatty-acid--CoA ligase [Blastocatellia bacterium]